MKPLPARLWAVYVREPMMDTVHGAAECVHVVAASEDSALSSVKARLMAHPEEFKITLKSSDDLEFSVVDLTPQIIEWTRECGAVYPEGAA